MSTVGIVGLGLIGGSLARAYKEASERNRVLAFNRTAETVLLAKSVKVVDEELTENNIGECDIVLVCLYPQSSIDYIKKMAPHLKKGAVVVDCCGVKQIICDALFPVAEEYGFTFIGGHPMAGTQFSGFLKSKGDLYNNATMILVPPVYDDILLLEKVKGLLSPVGFGRFVVTTPEKHDRMISYTSQMCHLISNAFIKSPTAQEHFGYSAGSYRDLTRVAYLNETMWTELFLENRENLINELDIYIKSLTEYKEALEKEDEEGLKKLLRDGRIAKELVDGIK